mgnify:CR=1 FL=1|tara:strand:+ start:428 stop:772 length:345 start_codon:yes stop_codon:yes gene_type:complete
MENNIKQLRKEFSKGIEKYLTKNEHMQDMSEKELLDWVFPEYVAKHKLEGVKALLGFTQAYEKGNIFDIKEIQVTGVYNHDIYGTLRGDDLMSPKSTSYLDLYNNDEKLNQYRK